MFTDMFEIIAPFVYAAAAFALVYALVTVFARSPLALPPFGLLLVLGAEIGFTVLAAARSGSSFYRPMFPDFAAGLIVGGLTIATAKPFLSFRAVRVLVTFIFCFWSIGIAVTDLLWYSEGTQRGTGPLWSYPVLSTFLATFAFFLLNTAAVGFFQPVFDMWADGASTAAYVAVALAVIVIWFFWRNQRERLAMLAVACSLALLGLKLIEWAPFIAD